MPWPPEEPEESHADYEARRLDHEIDGLVADLRHLVATDREAECSDHDHVASQAAIIIERYFTALRRISRNAGLELGASAADIAMAALWPMEPSISDDDTSRAFE